MINFNEVYKENKNKVNRYLYYLCGDKYLAEELTQETFYQVYISYKNFKGKSSLTTWIIAISRRVYLKHLRKEQHYSSVDMQWDDLPALGNDLPEISLDYKEQQAELIEILKMLPEVYRTVVVLREIEGRSFQEIAATIEKSPATTRVILSRAKKRFRELYNKKYGE